MFFICSPGSVIVNLVLRFKQNVSVSNVLYALKTAAKEEKFGSFIVDPSSIEQTPSSTSCTSPTPTPCTQGTALVLSIFKITYFYTWYLFHKEIKPALFRRYEVIQGHFNAFNTQIVSF